MSADDASSAVTYTSISSDLDGPSWGIPFMDPSELPEMDPYEDAAQQGHKVPPPPTYVSDPIELEDHVPVYVPEPMYPQNLAPSNHEIPMKDQPIPEDASPVALSPGYIANYDPEDDEEDPEDDPANYPADGGDDDDDESSNDDDDDDDEEEEDEDEEKENLALTNSTVVSSAAVDHVPSAKETDPFQTDESAATPPPPHVARLLALPTLPPSPLTPLSSPLPQIPSPPLPPSPPTYTSPLYAKAPFSYKAARIRLRAESPLPLPAPSSHLPVPTADRREVVTEANLPPQKRLCLTAPTSRLDIGESSGVGAARQPGSSVAHRADYGFVDTMDASIRAAEQRAMATVELVNLRVTYQASARRWESNEYLSSLYNAHKQERVEAGQALDRSESHNRALEAQIAVLETQTHRHEWQRQDANDHATGHIMRIQALEAGARVDTLEDTGSSD
ncbi:hypothetical protein Tco_0807554 [Tanacetum coccineum]